ncbi:MAG: hypothetical protein LBH72_00415 [Proteiniphilum sp.]|jgi:hypothetical protein|nr:hypothetical protein [Proteiniphilum sp.]
MLTYIIITGAAIATVAIGHFLAIQQMVAGGTVALFCTAGVFIGQSIKHKSANRIPKKEMNKAIVTALIALFILFFGFAYGNGQYLILSLALNLLLAIRIFCRLKKTIRRRHKAGED